MEKRDISPADMGSPPEIHTDGSSAFDHKISTLFEATV